MTPIVEPERHIAILLNFKDDDSVAQSVNRSCRNEDRIARLRINAHHVVRNRLVFKRTPKNARGDPRPEPGIDSAAFGLLPPRLRLQPRPRPPDPR